MRKILQNKFVKGNFKGWSLTFLVVFCLIILNIYFYRENILGAIYRIELDNRSEETCALLNGRWAMGECEYEAFDAGKPCKDSDDCIGYCLVIAENKKTKGHLIRERRSGKIWGLCSSAIEQQCKPGNGPSVPSMIKDGKILNVICFGI